METITPTTPANLSIGLFKNYLRNIARSKRDCDHGKRLEVSSIKTYASCANCFVNRVAGSRPLNKVLHPNFLKRVEQNDRNGALKKVIQMDRNGLKVFRQFYEHHCKGKYKEEELYVDDPNLEIVKPDTIIFQNKQVTETSLHKRIREHFANIKGPEFGGNLKVYLLLKEYDEFKERQIRHHFFESNGINIELVLANSE